MSKHTPGPWEVRENGDGGDFIICPVGFDTLVAEVVAEDVFEDESLANARLIAAAPDLLAACEVALRELSPGTRTQDFSEAYRIRREATEAIEAAIAKATEAP